MSEHKVFENLDRLSKTETELLLSKQRRSDFLAKRKALEANLLRLKKDLQSREQSLSILKQKQNFDEDRLRSEEKKIVERRKQLSALGGTKGAKLVEREVDIATRNLAALEEKVLQSMGEIEGSAALIEKLKVEVEQGSKAFNELLAEEQSLLSQIDARLVELTAARESALAECPAEVRSLYLRVINKYPGGAVAVAENGVCQSCNRTLPAQTFNLVLRGDVLNCPDCSRILILRES